MFVFRLLVLALLVSFSPVVAHAQPECEGCDGTITDDPGDIYLNGKVPYIKWHGRLASFTTQPDLNLGDDVTVKLVNNLSGDTVLSFTIPIRSLIASGDPRLKVTKKNGVVTKLYYSDPNGHDKDNTLKYFELLLHRGAPMLKFWYYDFDLQGASADMSITIGMRDFFEELFLFCLRTEWSYSANQNKWHEEKVVPVP